jgi:hypothetical protein
MPIDKAISVLQEAGAIRESEKRNAVGRYGHARNEVHRWQRTGLSSHQRQVYDPKYSDWEIGYCTKPDGTDITQELVVKGFALACPRTDDRHVQFQAEGEKVGVQKGNGTAGAVVPLREEVVAS